MLERVARAVRAPVRVDVGRRTRLAGNAERGRQLLLARHRCVREAEPDGRSALVEPEADSFLDRSDLLRARDFGLRGVRGQKRASVAHHCHADRYMSDARAVVHDLATLALTIESRDVAAAHLELEPRRDPVVRHEAVGLVALAVLMQVDEAGRDDEARHVDDPLTGERLLRYGLDFPAPDAHVADSVQPGLGVHYPSPAEHGVVGAGPVGAGGDSGDHRDGGDRRQHRVHGRPTEGPGHGRQAEVPQPESSRSAHVGTPATGTVSPWRRADSYSASMTLMLRAASSAA